MTVLGCAACDRKISVSFYPEGNPAALADPEHWAIIFGVCEQCGISFCDRCLGDKRTCLECGGSIIMHEPGDGYANKFIF